MKVSLFKIKLNDIDGNKLKQVDENDKEVVKGAHNLVAGILYVHSENLDLVNIAENMNKGIPVEMAPSHIKEMRKLMVGRLAAFVRKAVLDYLDDLESEEKRKKKKARR